MKKREELVELKKNNIGNGLLIENDGYISLDDNKQLTEDINGSEGWHVPYPFVVNSVFQKYGIKNANGRIYPEDVLKKQVELYQVRINERRALGECNHPSDSTIDLGRVSHNITELHWEGRTLVGKMELNITEGFRRFGIASSLGDTVAQLLLNGYKIGVSSRGIGNVEQDRMGRYIVTEFELICFDIVSDPSTNNAWIGSEEELRPYIESKEETEVKDGKKENLLEKVKKIKNIFND